MINSITYFYLHSSNLIIVLPIIIFISHAKKEKSLLLRKRSQHLQLIHAALPTAPLILHLQVHSP